MIKASKVAIKKTEKIGLFVKLKAKNGKEGDLEKFLVGGLDLVNSEVDTLSWFAFQLDESTFGIFDTFEVEFGRQAHLKGQVVKALLSNAEELLDNFSKDSIQEIEVLATNHKSGTQQKGLFVLMTAKAGKTSDVEGFLNVGKGLVGEEPETLSWYALKFDEGTYAIFDTFEADKGRDAHLNGAVAAALLKNAPDLLQGFEASAIQKTNILASK